MENVNKGNHSLKSIQLLRAIAALGVVYCHYALYAFPEFATGAFGVDIFFVISGFIIAFVVSRTTADFFLKRIFRIVPLYIIATSATILAALVFPQWFYNTTITIGAVIKSALFIPYRIGASGPILLAGWTLNFEMFFYVTMALCISFTRNKNVLAILCAGLLVLFVLMLNALKLDNYILEFYRTGLFPEFIYGLALYHFYAHYEKRDLKETSMARTDKQRFAVLAKVTMLSTIAIVSLIFLILSEMPGTYKLHIFENRNIQFGIPALIFVAAVLFLEKHIRDDRFVKFGLLLGNASYAMYLFHPYFVYFLQRVIYPNIFGTTDILLVELLKVLIVILVTILGSVCLYQFIDSPIQEYLRHIRLNKKLRLAKREFSQQE